MTGTMNGRLSVAQIWDQVKANSTRLQECKLHHFTGRPATGIKWRCTRCDGEMSGSDVLWYIRGYEAHGGQADDVVPGWHAPKG